MGSCMSNVFKIIRPQFSVQCTSSCCSGSIVNVESSEPPDGEEKQKIEQRGGGYRTPTT